MLVLHVWLVMPLKIEFNLIFGLVTHGMKRCVCHVSKQPFFLCAWVKENKLRQTCILWPISPLCGLTCTMNHSRFVKRYSETCSYYNEIKFFTGSTRFIPNMSSRTDITLESTPWDDWLEAKLVLAKILTMTDRPAGFWDFKHPI